MNFNEIIIGNFKINNNLQIVKQNNSEFSQQSLNCKNIYLNGYQILLDLCTKQLYLDDKKTNKTSQHISIQKCIVTDDFIIDTSPTSIWVIPLKIDDICQLFDNYIIVNNKKYLCDLTNYKFENKTFARIFFKIDPFKNKITEIYSINLLKHTVEYDNTFKIGKNICFPNNSYGVCNLINYNQCITGHDTQSAYLNYAINSNRLSNEFLSVSSIENSKQILISTQNPKNIKYKIFGNYNELDEFIIKHALLRWESILKSIDLQINIHFCELHKNLMCISGPTQFNKKIPKEGLIYINNRYWNNEKFSYKYDYNSNAYHMLIDEIEVILSGYSKLENKKKYNNSEFLYVRFIDSWANNDCIVNYLNKSRLYNLEKLGYVISYENCDPK